MLVTRDGEDNRVIEWTAQLQYYERGQLVTIKRDGMAMSEAFAFIQEEQKVEGRMRFTAHLRRWHGGRQRIAPEKLAQIKELVERYSL